jgi:hypothetical protein
MICQRTFQVGERRSNTMSKIRIGKYIFVQQVLLPS